MRSLTRDELNEIYNEEEMLKGNISSMCVSHDIQEFAVMRSIAIARINTIADINLKRFRGSEDNE